MAPCSISTAPTSTRCSVSPSRATWAPTWCSSICTRRSRLRTVAVGRAPVRSASRSRSSRSCPSRASFAMRRDCGWTCDRPDSIGKLRSFFGNFGMLVRAYTYILSLGGDGLEQVSRRAILGANYVRERLREHFPSATDEPVMHECVLTHELEKKRRHHAGHRQAAARLRDPSANHLFSPGGSRRTDDRADRDRKQTDPG